MAVDCIFAWLIACRHETFETTVVIGVLEAPDSLVRSLGLTYTQLLAFLSWPLRPPLPTPPPPITHYSSVTVIFSLECC